MNPTNIPKLTKEQTKQLINDINRKPTKEELEFCRSAVKDSKKIKIE